MTETDIYLIASLLSFFIYNFYILRYATKILSHSIESNILKLLFTSLNTILIYVVYQLHLPHYLVYMGCLLVLMIEFKTISEASFKQIWAGASIFIMHISMVHLVVSYIVGVNSGIYPYATVEIPRYRYESLFITCVILIVVLLLLEVGMEKAQIIALSDIKRLTSSDQYSYMLAIFATAVVITNSIFAQLFLSRYYYVEQAILLAAMTVFSIVMFYYIFIYTIHFVRMVVYKRYTDAIREEHRAVSQVKDKLQSKIDRDELTNLYNKKYILSIIDNYCAAARTDFGVIFIDVNGLKHINDTLGHSAGDKLLIQIANAVSMSLREEDVVARISGDEFLVVINEADQSIMETVVYRIETNIDMYNSFSSHLVSASLGWVIVDKDLLEAGTAVIIEKADAEMFKNKAEFYRDRGEFR